jgi:hypothetical protein
MSAIASNLSANYPQLAEQMLIDLNKVSQSMNDIISDVDLKQLGSKSIEQAYQSFGIRYIQYLQADIALNQARSALSAIPSNKDFLRLSEELAPIKFKARYCQESRSFIMHQLFKKNVFSHIICFYNRNTKDCHTFNLLGFSQLELDAIVTPELAKAEKSHSPVVFDMNKLAKGYIIDGYLNYHGLVSNYTDSPLHVYMKKLGITELVQYGPATPSAEVAQRVEQEVEEIFTYVKQNANRINHAAHQRAAFLAEKLNERGNELLQSLKKHFPDVEWKKKIKDGNLNVWVEGQQEKLTEMKQFLLTKGFSPIFKKIANKETYCLLITNPTQELNF